MQLLDARVADVPVLNTLGQEHKLGRYYLERTAVLVWIRHFGCIGCRAHVSELRPHVAAVRAHGAELVLIGNGSVVAARSFRELMELGDVPLLCDPSLASHRLVGLERGLWSVLRPRAFGNRVRALLQGHRYGPIQGDALQQGGTLVVTPDGHVVFRHVARALGDRPAMDAVLSALAATHA